MRRLITVVSVIAAFYLHSAAQITLDECIEKAIQNYPIIKKYDLIARTGTINLSDINKSWLPGIKAYGQISVQNAVPEFPEIFTDILEQMGQQMQGMKHAQYKAGIDITQNIWDGGASKSNRAIRRAETTESKAAVDVQLYALREKVQNLYFGILLMDEQIRQSESTISLLKANHTQLTAMFDNGAAMQSDADMIEAQILTMGQRITEAQSTVDSYRKMLETYIGETIGSRRLTKPSADIPLTLTSNRPELKLSDARLKLNEAKENTVNTTVMPRLGLFAQTYYGYPGFNYFENMINRDLSFNILAGVKISWNIDSFYMRKNSRKKLEIASADITTERDIFLFNSRLLTQSQIESINGLKKIIDDDAKIIELRANVRKAAETQLENGIIDTTALLAKITDENQARLSAGYHEIQLLQLIHQLKYTLNR